MHIVANSNANDFPGLDQKSPELLPPFHRRQVIVLEHGDGFIAESADENAGFVGRIRCGLGEPGTADRHQSHASHRG